MGTKISRKTVERKFRLDRNETYPHKSSLCVCVCVEMLWSNIPPTPSTPGPMVTGQESTLRRWNLKSEPVVEREPFFLLGGCTKIRGTRSGCVFYVQCLCPYKVFCVRQSESRLPIWRFGKSNPFNLVFPFVCLKQKWEDDRRNGNVRKWLEILKLINEHKNGGNNL